MRKGMYFVSHVGLFSIVAAPLFGCGNTDGGASQPGQPGGGTSKGGTSGQTQSGVGGASGPSTTSGGAVAAGGAAVSGLGSGGLGNGGASTAASGSATVAGGASSGGSNSGGADTGGSNSGGTTIGGTNAGGGQTGIAGSATVGGTNAGGASVGGTNTTAGAPNVQNSFIVQSPAGIVDKMDVLFSIDNSLSMGDKQAVLAAAVPQLLRRLTNPDCVDTNVGSSAASVPMADPTVGCPTGFEREFAPVNDIHIGIVTSSLGDYGGDVCPEDGAQNASQNDHAWLIGALPRTAGKLPAFLGWSNANAVAYATSIQPKLDEFKNLVTAVTELGCGNEMTLETWYRFLIDPKPTTDVVSLNQAANVRGPVDDNILNQRKTFLRPDSLVAVVMLSDENDCSLRDDVYGWVPMTASGGFRMWRGSAVCATNPNDPCCYSCMLPAPANCQAPEASCTQGDTTAKLAPAADDVNMRCRSMKRRFGFDFLFPTTRYVNALTKLQLCPEQTYGDLDCDCTAARALGVACTPGTPVPNPLYQNLNPNYVPTGPVRLDASSVFLAGIVGVPWQDLAEDSSLAASAPLKYRLATQLNWDLFSPKDALTLPLDPLMIEQSAPRSGTHPITKEALAAPTAARMANSINGHEWNTSDKDMQFACIFSLDQPITAGQSSATRVCDIASECGAAADTDEYKICSRRFDGCSCTLTAAGASTPSPLDPTVSLSPLCQAPSGQYGNKQYFAKAYPGGRELAVLRGFFEASAFSRDNAIAASICPKDLNVANSANPGYGYNPAMRALVDRLKDNIGGSCLPRPLAADSATGKVPCALVEAITPEGAAEGSCDCAAKQRDAVDAATQLSMRTLLEERGTCAGASCEKFCFCRLRQLLPGTTAGNACLNDLNAARTTNPPGFCYIDPPNHGNPSLVSDCDVGEQRTLRIVGNTSMGLGAPAKGPVFYTCSGSPYTTVSTQ